MGSDIDIEIYSPSFFAIRRSRKSTYQLALVTPGIFPSSAIERKHNLQTPNLRIYARDRPQMLHRLCFRTGNFGVFFALTTIAKRATTTPC
jgi:hypothetical protein